MIYIYVIQLESKTTNPHFRLENHFISQASKWTIA